MGVKQKGLGWGGGSTSQEGRGWRCLLEDGRGGYEQRVDQILLLEELGLSKDSESGMCLRSLREEEVV